jgi:hypothetical protein
MILSPLGLNFSSIGVLKLLISAFAWAKIAVHVCLHRIRQGSADVPPRVPKIAVHQGAQECAVNKPYEKGLWKE